MSENERYVAVSKMDELDSWIEELISPVGQLEKLVEEVAGSNNGNEIIRRFNIYTDNHKYYIVAIDEKGKSGYLGCTADCRKPRAGEHWFRGNDLPDGEFTKQTWIKILNGIIRYELVQLSEHRKSELVPET